jgi:hypothetical protein
MLCNIGSMRGWYLWRGKTKILQVIVLVVLNEKINGERYINNGAVLGSATTMNLKL